MSNFHEKLDLLKDQFLVDRANEIISDLRKYLPDGVKDLTTQASTVPVHFESLPIPVPQLPIQQTVAVVDADQNSNLKVTGFSYKTFGNFYG